MNSEKPESDQISPDAMLGYKILAVCAALIAIGVSFIHGSHHSSVNQASPYVTRYIEFMTSPIVLLCIAAVLVFEVVRGKLTRWRLVGAAYLIGGTVAGAIHKLVMR